MGEPFFCRSKPKYWSVCITLVFITVDQILDVGWRLDWSWIW